MNTPLSRLQHDLSLAPGIPDSTLLMNNGGPTVSTYGDLREVAGRVDRLSAIIGAFLNAEECRTTLPDDAGDAHDLARQTHVYVTLAHRWLTDDEHGACNAAFKRLAAVPPSQADHIPDAGKMVPPSQGMETVDSGLAAADNNHKALVEALTAALAKYGAHELECEIVEDGPACSCGFHDALTAFQSRQEEG